MSINYQELDALIIKSMEDSRSNPLYDPYCQEEARRLEQQHGGEDFRYIDLRLQTLRKAGVITYLKRSEAPNQSVLRPRRKS